MRVDQNYLAELIGFDGLVCLYISANGNIRGSGESSHVPIREKEKRHKNAHWSDRREPRALIGQKR